MGEPKSLVESVRILRDLADVVAVRVDDIPGDSYVHDCDLPGSDGISLSGVSELDDWSRTVMIACFGMTLIEFLLYKISTKATVQLCKYVP